MLESVALSLPGDSPDPGIEPLSQASPILAGGFFTANTIVEASICLVNSSRINCQILKPEGLTIQIRSGMAQVRLGFLFVFFYPQMTVPP